MSRRSVHCTSGASNCASFGGSTRCGEHIKKAVSCDCRIHVSKTFGGDWPSASSGVARRIARPSVRPSVCPSVRSSACPSVRLSVRTRARALVCPPAFPPVRSRLIPDSRASGMDALPCILQRDVSFTGLPAQSGFPCFPHQASGTARLLCVSRFFERASRMVGLPRCIRYGLRHRSASMYLTLQLSLGLPHGRASHLHSIRPSA